MTHNNMLNGHDMQFLIAVRKLSDTMQPKRSTKSTCNIQQTEQR